MKFVLSSMETAAAAAAQGTERTPWNRFDIFVFSLINMSIIIMFILE